MWVGKKRGKAIRTIRGAKKWLKKKRNLKSTAVVVKGGNPFPDKYFAKFRYIDDIALGGALFQHNVYRGNSLFDPDFTGIGHQPMGFDTLCGASKTNAPYLSYTVRNCYLKIDVVNTSATVPFYIVIYPSRESTVPASITEGFEQPNGKYTVVPINASTSHKTLYKKMSTAKIFGETSTVVGTENQYSAQYNANPVDVWFWNIYAVACDGASTISGRVRVELIYSAEMSDRNQLQAS